MQFSHLHTHTQYSLLDGAASIKRLYDKAYADGMPALAITDHGNMYGVFDFVAEAWKRKESSPDQYVKPIVGCEFYLVEDRHKKSFSREARDKRYHQLLLAKNETGYKNLTKLCSLGFTEGLYSKWPRIDKELLAKYSEGLIATSCCIGAEIPQSIIYEGEEAAEKKLKWWLDLFGEDYYLEVQRHGMPEEEKVNNTLLKFAEKYQVEVIATNDSHYVDRDDYESHDILLCVNTGRKLHEPILKDFNPDDSINRKDYRFGFFNDEFYFKTQKEMEKLFHDIPYAVANTQQIVDKVDMLDLKKDILLPNFPLPDGFLDQDQYLEHLTWEGAHRRYSEITPEIEERIKYELSIIRNMGFAGYFLIVSDFIQHGKDIGVYIGPGRGSAAGSAVAYCINITNIDPIKYNLLFERFLNPDRNSMPDIDTDFDDEGRQKVIDYVVEKYKKEQVAHIVTFGTMKARSSIKDVGRVMDVPLAQVNALAALVPASANSLNNLMDPERKIPENQQSEKAKIEELRRLKESNSVEGNILRQALKLEGSVRNVGVHAAGIIIAPEDISNILPVSANPDTALNITQYPGDIIEESGVIKMDFLGLKTLSILKDAAEIVDKVYDRKIDVDDIPLDDEFTLTEIYQKGNTNGIFQFESPGMKTWLTKLQPDSIEDIIAMCALYRPGPMEYIPSYIKRKKGLEEITYDLEGSEEHLEQTYGITVYQEQVMLLAQKIASFTPGQADSLRKIMGKKLPEKLAPFHEKFIAGGQKNGHPKDKLEKVWNDWAQFAHYAFNKSHATCYAVVSFQTAYFKAHYPSAFMASLLNHAGSLDKMSEFLSESKKLNINVLGPDINESIDKFFVNDKDEIRFGLNSIKGVNTSGIQAIIEERNLNGPYTSIYDFMERIPLADVNKKTIENLAAVGAFDEIDEHHRAQYVGSEDGSQEGAIEALFNYGKAKSGIIGGNSMTLFGSAADTPVDQPKFPNIEKWSDKHKLNKEKELIGLFFSGHPLDRYEFLFKNLKLPNIQQVNQEAKLLEEHWAEKRINENINDATLKATLKNIKKPYRMLVMVDSVRNGETKTGKPMCIFDVSDHFGEANLAMFGETSYNYSKYIIPGRMIYLQLNIESDYRSLGSFRLSPISVIPAEEVLSTVPRRLEIKIKPEEINDALIEYLQEQHTPDSGQTKLQILLETESLQELVLTGNQALIELNTDFTEFLESSPDIKFQLF